MTEAEKIEIPEPIEEAVKETLVQLVLKNIAKAFRWLRKR